jgi:hypothetical protein
MVLKSEMEKENEKLGKKIKRLENKVKKLKSAVKDEKDAGEYRIKYLAKEREEKEELRNKIFELEQQIDADETKGPVFQVCDPLLQNMHKRRDLGVDVYVERHMDDTKVLLTRIPISLDSELCEDMTFEQRAAMLDPLVRGLRCAYSKSDEPFVHIEVSINEMYWTDE